MDKVDVHVHIFAKLSDEYPRGISGLAPADKEATAEQLLREMDAAGGSNGSSPALYQQGRKRQNHGRHRAEDLVQKGELRRRNG